MHLHCRPVVAATFALNYGFSGLQPHDYHCTNLAIHVLSGLALFGLARRTLLAIPRYAPRATVLALLVALFWTVHPLQTQAVSYIVQRFESLMGLLFFTTVYAAARGMASSRPRWWFVGSAAACWLALGCKEVAIVLPIVTLLYDRAFFGGSFREAWRGRRGLYLAMFASWLVFGPFYRAYSGSEGRWAGFAISTRWYEYAWTQPAVILRYLRLCFWPADQCLDYGWPIARTAAEIVPAALCLGVLVVATIWATWRAPRCGFLGDWFFLILMPTSSVMPIDDLAYEHRMYLPSAAVAAGFVVAMYEVGRRLAPSPQVKWGRGILLAVPALLIALLGTVAFQRNRVFATERAIWEDTVRKRPENVVGHTNLGVVLMSENDLVGARQQLLECFASPPTPEGHSRSSAISGSLNCTATISTKLDAISRGPWLCSRTGILLTMAWH